ncbi:Nn.00g029480.m01.CDS01 [Neocucurbitaria sp. VM-36]
MPPRPFLNDALWRCLCPDFLSNASAQKLARTGARSLQRNRPRRNTTTQPSSCQSHAYTTFPSSNPPFSQKDALSSEFPLFNQPARLSPRKRSRDKPSLAQIPTHILYEHVRAEGAKGNFDEVMNICRVLVKDRGEPLNKDMYTAILHSFVSSSNGTAGKVRKVLEEMGFWGDANESLNGQLRIELDARGCECVLEALAVHPDYLLRTEILEYMKSRWFTLSDRGQNFVVAGMLRERQFEHALETLEDMMKRKVRIENWLLDKAMWMLLEYGEVEEAFYVLSLKEGVQSKGEAGTVKLSDALWGALLDAAAQKHMHQATSMVWMTQVQPGYLKPGTGTCLSVLIIASRNGDVQLATDVFRVLTERETSFTTHHYEQLITTYLNANDLSAALSVILIMVQANVKIDAGTCNPLYCYMINEKADEGSRPMHAFSQLQELEAAGHKVPTATVNACIQASITLNRFEEAIEIYKALHTVSHEGPNTQTFNNLFRGCHRTARKELAMFFANEMIQLGLKPDLITYDRLILVCVQSSDLEDALLYYEEMRATGSGKGSMKPRPRTWELLIHKCVVEGDERAVALLKDYKENVEEPRKHVEKAVMDRFAYGIKSDGLQGKQVQSEGNADDIKT